MALPDFVVAGVPKSGTTALHAALARHPGLFLSPIKEPKFFLTDGPPPTRGGPGDALTYREHVWQRDRYEALFDAAPAGTLRGEATPLYLYDQAAMARIRKTIPDVKLIVILRDPVERAHSNWTHLWSAGLEPIGDFVRACAEEEQRIAAGWASFWHYKGLGRYGEQLAHAFTLFPRDQVLALRYRLLIDEPAATLDKICAFLGVETGLLTEIPRENVTAHPERTLAHRAVSLGMRASDAVGRLLPGSAATAATHRLERFLQRDAGTRQPLGWEQRQALLPAFADDVKLLETVLGEDFSDWLAPRDRSGGLVGARPVGKGQAKNGLQSPGGPAKLPQLGHQSVRPIRLGELVVQPGAPVRQVDQVEVAQPAARPRRERVRARPRCRRRDQRGRVGADRDAGPLLVVLGCARPPVVVGDHLVRLEANGGDPGAPGVPLARPARQRGALPGPVEPVRAGGVLGAHLVGLIRVGQRVNCRPHVPLAVMALDHRVLDRSLTRVARQHDLAGADVELGRVGGVDDLDPPVLGPGGGAAQVQPPAAVRELDELRALERLGVGLVLGDDLERLVEVHAVGGEGDRHRVAAAAADRAAQPAGEIKTAVRRYRGRAAGPESAARARGANRDRCVGRTGNKHVTPIATNHVGIIDNSATWCSHSFRK
jgi:Sulfotransferase family